MSAAMTVLVVALMGQSAHAGPVPAPEAGPSESFLEYLALFEPDDEATLVDFALDAEEADESGDRTEDEGEEDDDDAA